LAAESRLAPRTVRHALNDLRGLGVLEEDVNFADARKRLYRVCPSEAVEWVSNEAGGPRFRYVVYDARDRGSGRSAASRGDARPPSPPAFIRRSAESYRMTRRVIIDTDTAGDDAMAILVAALADSVDVEALTVVAGNVEFEHQVENAKYTLQLADAADDVPVYEGARTPLVKDHEHADQVHGEGGLGGELFPDTGVPSADEHAANAIVERARESPGELSLVCIGPLTNVALALRLEPDLNELLDEVWVMGGAVNTIGNDTPSAEYNFWVDPDAATVVVDELDVTLVDWGLCGRQGTFYAETLDRIAAMDTPYAEFFTTVAEHVREFTRSQSGEDATTQPDSLTLACAVYPGLVTETSDHYVDVDEREGLTRGYSLVDELDVTAEEPNARIVESVDEAAFERLFLDTMAHGDPERSL
jgi:purine nucleosidase